MESFLLVCDAAFILLAVLLGLLDEKRKPGVPRSSPLRINEHMLANPSDRRTQRALRPSGRGRRR